MRLNCARCGLTISPRFASLTVEHCPRCLGHDRVAIRLTDPDRAPGDDGDDDAHGLGARGRSIEGG
jgi:hypothetical protein